MKEPTEDLPQRVEDALVSILRLPEADRAEALDALCTQHPDLRTLILARAALAEADDTVPPDPPKAPPSTDPEQIGPYRILDTLGEGGMGTVYLAEQKEPVRRRVALKVIKLGMDSKQVVSRFELERQALAVMNHPAIAKVFEAGITGQGQPYFVMEFVEGTPITDYCDQHKLDLKQRIDIFQQVCRGVQHAHQKGVVHRDLKPGNVLVSRKGDEHAVKIIDFGLARATDHQLVDNTIYTEQGAVIGTPEYMSPEQASGVALDIDTRTDVYSLGVMLYELLTGELPFTTRQLREAGLFEIQRILAEVEPAKPSTKISSAGDAASGWASKRRISVAALRRQLKGDLDWIVLRAMAKEPERRYGSALGLALDLGKYLEHEPVEAGPPSATYRLSKFARKYRVQVTAALLVVVVAIVGAVVAWRYARIAEGNEAEAKRQESVAKENEAEAKRQESIAKENAAEAKRQEEIAKAERNQVRKEKSRFDRLSVVVQLEDAKAEISKLQPAWPEKSPALKEWLKGRGDKLEAELPEVRRILQELRDRALPRTPEQETEDREGHPRHPAYLVQRDKVAALRRAMTVREGGAAKPAPLPEDAPTDPAAINTVVWPKVSPDEKERQWGDEALALTLARRSVQLASEQKHPKRHMFGDTLAWALFANGLDEEALAASRAALEAAPAVERKEYEGYVSKLKAAIAAAPETLAAAEKELARLEKEVAERQTYEFSDQADRFLYQTMLRVERDLVAFLGPEGARIDAQRRLTWAERVAGLTQAHPNAPATWADVREALRKADGETASELYGAKYHKEHPIDLQPQTGLVPIGMNPETKLWEFYHLRSAYDPRTDADPGALAIPRHAEDGSIPVTEKTGIVFVLLPGGTYTMGAQKTDPDGKNYDPQAERDEIPKEQTVAPFFLARHELTQGQWVRLSLQENPSRYAAGANIPPKPVTLAHPVEQVDWHMCTALLARHGLQLPHEIEWEYGCRAGKDTSWFSGKTAADLEGFANLLDPYAKEKVPAWSGEPVPFRDGYVIHAPVGTFGFNPFGLYDVHGNAREWCRNLYSSTSRVRVYRGGSFSVEARLARSASAAAARPRSVTAVWDCVPPGLAASLFTASPLAPSRPPSAAGGAARKKVGDAVEGPGQRAQENRKSRIFQVALGRGGGQGAHHMPRAIKLAVPVPLTHPIMRFRLFTLRYSSTLGGFDDQPLQDFVRDKEVSAFREHFFVVEDMPHLCCVVTWLDQVIGKHPRPELQPAVPSKPRNGKPDPTAGLDPVQRALFQRMREWRTETARDEGVPPYVVLTNRELVELVQKRPDSATALAAIDGIGKQRVQRFGKRILAALHGAAPAPEPESTTGEEAST